MNRQRLAGSSVKEVIYNAVWELTSGDTTVTFTNREVIDLISKQNLDFRTSNVGCELRADCVNNPERDHQYPGRINYDYYWRVARGKYRLYDPETDHNSTRTIKDIALHCWWYSGIPSKKKLAE